MTKQTIDKLFELKHLVLPGYCFMLTVLLQNQMTSLIALASNKNFPSQNLEKNIHALLPQLLQAWEEKTFRRVKEEFVATFKKYITTDDELDLNCAEVLRNALAHAQVEWSRETLWYKPRSKNEQKVVEALDLAPVKAEDNSGVIEILITKDHIAFIHRLRIRCYAIAAPLLAKNDHGFTNS